MADTSSQATAHSPAHASQARDWRLHKHADYQRVYKVSRKQFASFMAYFAAARTAESLQAGPPGPRIGLTVGRVLGKAVDRNRIKRRMRAAVRQNLSLLTENLDVVLHPKRSVLDADYNAVAAEIRRIFQKLQEAGVSALRAQDRPVSFARSGKRA